ncbi:MAG: DUF2079 domain-containing protein [Chloroflexi bacterium]|nr:DUF2079 domain-containing protein [Chloroflexota bacterium]
MATDFGLILALSFGVAMVGYLLWPRFSFQLPKSLADGLFYGMAVLFMASVSILAVLRHDAFHSHAYDLGIFDQVIWNSARGRLFQNSIMVDSPSFLGHHFSPLLLALVPLYWVWPDPRALLLTQVLALTATALPIYWWARERLGPGLSLAVGTTYFLSPAVAYVALFDFHEIALAAPLLSFALYFMFKRRDLPFLLALLIALLAKEEIGIVVAALGLYLALGQRRLWLGAGLFVLGAAWAYSMVTMVIPAFHPSGKFYFALRYTKLGASQGEILGTVLTRPIYTLGLMLNYSKLQYVHHLLVPLGYLPLLSPGLLAVSLPSLAYLLLQDDFSQAAIITQYSAPLLPLLFFVLIQGRQRPRVRGAMVGLLLTAGFLSYYLHGPLPFSRSFDQTQYVVTPHAQVGQRLLLRVPPEARVAAQSDLVPHLSQRETVFMFPWMRGMENLDYLFLDRKGNNYPFDDADYEEMVAGLLADPAWGIEADEDGYLLLRRREPRLGRLFGGG